MAGNTQIRSYAQYILCPGRQKQKMRLHLHNIVSPSSPVEGKTCEKLYNAHFWSIWLQMEHIDGDESQWWIPEVFM